MLIIIAENINWIWLVDGDISERWLLWILVNLQYSISKMINRLNHLVLVCLASLWRRKRRYVCLKLLIVLSHWISCNVVTANCNNLNDYISSNKGFLISLQDEEEEEDEDDEDDEDAVTKQQSPRMFLSFKSKYLLAWILFLFSWFIFSPHSISITSHLLSTLSSSHLHSLPLTSTLLYSPLLGNGQVHLLC